MKKTHEGGTTYEHSLDHALEFFSKAGSLFARRRSFYEGEESVLSLFQKAWISDNETAFKLLLWLRDCRGGAGNRSGFRECLKWLATGDDGLGQKFISQTTPWIKSNIGWIPEVGRWDDLRSLFGSELETVAAKLWAKAIKDGNALAAKWADRKDFPLKHVLGLDREGAFRKMLARTRKNHIVEFKMSSRLWKEIDYHTVPSLAMARYTNAFNRHDSERFAQYKQSLKKGKTTIHADVLFPHDCVRTTVYGDPEIADAQFEALPNFLEEADERIIVIADTSGSMMATISGSISAIHVSQGMALYCSAKIPEDNPFHKKFIAFDSESEFKFWKGMTFSQAVHDHHIFDGAVGGTRIDKALNLILNTAEMFSVPDSKMPTTLLIVSDMQFWQGASGSGTEVQKALRKWTDADYSLPKIVYWNTAGYTGSPETSYGDNVALVSGFSPAVLKAIFAGKDMSPTAVMLSALEKYDIVVPGRKKSAKKKAVKKKTIRTKTKR